jgi:hypothetical protein
MTLGQVTDEFSVPTGLTFNPVEVAYAAESGLPFGAAASGGRVWRLSRDGSRQLLVDGLRPSVNVGTVHDGALDIPQGGRSARISRLRLDGNRPPRPALDHLPGPGNYHTDMVALDPDNRPYFSQGAMTSSGIVGLDAYELGWLRRLPHPHDLSGFDVVLSAVEAKNADPLKEEARSRVRTGAFVPFGTRAQLDQRIVAALASTAAVMSRDPDEAELELVASGLGNIGFIAGGRVVAAFEPHLRIAGAPLLAAYAVWLVLEPFEWTPRGRLWVPAALSLDSLGAGVVLAGSALAYAVAALLGPASWTLAVLGLWAGQFVHSRAPSYATRLAGVALLTIALLRMAGVG